MTATYQVPLFDLVEFVDKPKERKIDYAREAIIEELASLRNCPDCGDPTPKGISVWDANHGIVFNGWCASHLFANNGVNSDQLAWLVAHGFELCDHFDPANWNNANLKYWNAL